jgi:hypothetical protein
MSYLWTPLAVVVCTSTCVQRRSWPYYRRSKIHISLNVFGWTNVSWKWRTIVGTQHSIDTPLLGGSLDTQLCWLLAGENLESMLICCGRGRSRTLSDVATHSRLNHKPDIRRLCIAVLPCPSRVPSLPTPLVVVDVLTIDVRCVLLLIGWMTCICARSLVVDWDTADAEDVPGAHSPGE